MDTKKQKFGWSGMMDNSGRLHISLYFPDDVKTVTQKQVLEATGLALEQGAVAMIKKGYIPPQARLMSSREIADRYGHTRQYWEKLLREGRLPYYQTAAGRITVDLWVQGYLQNKEAVDHYINCQKQVIKNIQNLKKRSSSSRMTCPNCGKEDALRFSVNTNEANGVCDNHCDFQFTVSL